jgi:outer membrane protein TolC
MIRTTASAVVLLALAGCASLSKDGGFDRVNALTKERTGQSAVWQRTDADHDAAQRRVSELLAQPLSADSVVEIALLNNRSLQASFADLGIAEADLVSAGRLPNPTFSFSHTKGNGIVGN